MIHASDGRCTGLHYGTYDYSASCGIAAAHQSLEHPAADHAKAVMQVAAAGHGRTPLRRVHQRAPGRRPRRRRRARGATTCAWSAGRWSAATTRAGTCTRPSCRPGTPRRSRSTAAGWRPRRGPAAQLRRAGGPPGSSTSRRPHGPWPTSCSAASTAAPCRPTRSAPRAASTRRALADLAHRTDRDGGLSRWGSSWDPTSTARPRAASSGSCATPPATRSATSTSPPRCAVTSPPPTSPATSRRCCPTDTQKNTAFAYAKEHGVTSPEDYALALARRLLEATPAATGARVRVEEYAWDRIPVDGAGHDHAFVRRGGEVRTTEVDLSSEGAHVVSGAHRPGRAQVDRLGVHGLPGRRVHDAPRGRGPHPRHLAHRDVALQRPAAPSRGTGRTTRCGRCCSPPSRRRTAAPSRRRCTPWDARCSRRTRGSRRSRSSPPTSTTSSWTSSPSVSTTPARSSSPRTGPTG